MQIITPTLDKMMKAFEYEGYNIRLVGGCVRDYVLGKEPKDIDLCTDADPFDMFYLAQKNGWKFFPTGIAHGTVTLKVDGELFEVTTLRVDEETDGRHAVIRFVTDFKQDAARRDFTMNAMFMDRQGNVADFFGGVEDLKAGIIRFIGDPEQRIKEDYLRILRLFRFARKMDLRTTTEDLMAVKDNVGGLKNISVERWWLEMSKLMDGSGENYYQILDHMDRLGVLKQMGLHYDPKVKMALNAISALAAMRPCRGQWKLSAHEKRMLDIYWKIWHDTSRQTMPLAYYQDKLVAGVPIEAVRQEAVWKRDDQFIWALNRWEVPSFPLFGRDLIAAGMETGPEMGEALRKAFDSWKESRYMKSKEELLKEVMHAK